MKTIITLLTIVLLQSCQSQSDFDLINIKLNKDKISEIIPKDISLNTFDAGLSGGDNKFASISSERILIFNKQKFAGRNPKANSENHVFFYFNKNDSIITKYSLYTFTAEESQKLIKNLNEKLGNSNFKGFSSEKDKAENNPSIYIWEDIDNTTLYHATYTKQHYGMETVLNVMPISTEYPALPGITYWESYLRERKKRNNPNYTYQQFILDETENDSDNLYNKLSK